MRPTAQNLAEAAGVSLATVDRVLNDRPNVSAKSRQKVNEAIDKIGFIRNPAAVSLARNRRYRFLFVLPKSGDLYLQELMQRVEDLRLALRGDLIDIDVTQQPTEDAHAMARYLTALSEDELDGVALMAPESPQVRDALMRLHNRNIKVVQFLSGQTRLPFCDFVGVDNYAAGATAAKIIGRFLGEKKGKILVVADTLHAQDNVQRRFGFDCLINEAFAHLSVLPSVETHSDPLRTTQILERTFAKNADICAVYLLSSEARIPITTIMSFMDLSTVPVVAHERTPFTEEALREDVIDAVIAQDPGHAVRSAVRLMRARSERREPLIDQEKIRIEVLFKENLL